MAKTFNLKRCLITVNGVPVSGFADGDAVTAARNEDSYSLTIGADGERLRNRSNNNSGRLTFNLMYSSPLNTVFQGLNTLDESTGLGQAAILITDLNSGSSAFAAQAWVVKPPDLTLGMEAGAREWVFETGDLQLNHAGILI